MNSAHSTGPRTPAGKQVSSTNSLKHGGYAGDWAIPTGPLREDPVELAEIKRLVIEALAPYNAAAFEAAQMVASRFVTERRLDAAEDAVFRAVSVDQDSLVVTNERQRRSLYSKDLQLVLDAREWISRAFDHIESTGSWKWYDDGLTNSLDARQAEALCRFLGRRLRPVVIDGVFDDEYEPACERDWKRVLRAYTLESFDGQLSALADWLEQEQRALETEVAKAERDCSDSDARTHARRFAESIATVAGVVTARAQNNRALALALALFEQLQGPDADS